MATSISRLPSLGSPWFTPDVTSLDTQSSDAIKVTGGTIDGVEIGIRTPARRLDIRTLAPLNNSQAVFVQHTTGQTPMTGARIYGTLSNAQQLVTSAAGLDDPASYVGLIGTGTARAIGGEGGFATTLASTAAGGATTLDLVDATGFVDGLRLQVVHDDGYVQPVDQVGPPVGNVITVDVAMHSTASAGAVVYVWHGAVKGIVGQGTTATGSVGMLVESAEFSMSCQAGSVPYIRNIVGITANADDEVAAIGSYDAGLYFSRQTGGAGYKFGISFDPKSGSNLVAPTGTLVRTFRGGYGSGIDFATSTFTDYSLKMPGFTVDGTGVLSLARIGGVPQIRYNNELLTPTTGGLWRTTSGAGNYNLQVNTAAGADFTAAETPLVAFANGSLAAAATSAAIATNSTGRFLLIPTMAGKPTGTPDNAAAGRTAIVYNSTHKQLCVYDHAAGAWYGVTLTTPL